MPKNKILKHFGTKSQLKRLTIACGKLSCACGEYIAAQDDKNLKYLARKIANVEFLHDQIKESFNLGENVYRYKYQVKDKLEGEIEKAG